MTKEERTKWLSSLKVGDEVWRILGGKIKYELKVTEVTDKLITCSAWTFSPIDGTEIDEYINTLIDEYINTLQGPGLKVTISYIIPPLDLKQKVKIGTAVFGKEWFKKN